MEPSIWIHLSPATCAHLHASYTSWFLHSPRSSFSAMAAELPPSRLKTTGSLATLR
jgi:hypothetical protein